MDKNDDLLKFHTGTVIWFDRRIGLGYIKDDNQGSDVRIIISHFSPPRMDGGKLHLGLNDQLPDVLPRKGDRVVFWVSQRRKGPDADHWCYLVQAAKVLRDDWVKKHDRCACGHLLADHTEFDDCQHCICNHSALCTCGHMPEDHESYGCMLCGCGHSEYDPRLDWFNDPDRHDYVEIPLGGGRTGVQVKDSHESNLGGSPGGLTIQE